MEVEAVNEANIDQKKIEEMNGGSNNDLMF